MKEETIFMITMKSIHYRLMTVPPQIVGRQISPMRDIDRENQHINEYSDIDDSFASQRKHFMPIDNRQLQRQLPTYLPFSGEIESVARNKILTENEGIQNWSPSNGKQNENMGTHNWSLSYERKDENAMHVIHNNLYFEDIVYFHQPDQDESSSESEFSSVIIKNLLQWKSNVNIFESGEEHYESPLKDMNIEYIMSVIPSRQITDENSETMETLVSEINISALKNTELVNSFNDGNSSNDDTTSTTN